MNTLTQPRSYRLVAAPEIGIAIDRRAAEMRAVIPFLQGDELGAVLLSTDLPILPRQTQRGLDRIGQAGAVEAVLPRPLFLLEPGRRRLVQQSVVRAVAHGSRRISPARPRPARGANDEPPWPSLQFDFFGKLGLFQQGPGDPDALRVADSDDSCLRRHVITS